MSGVPGIADADGVLAVDLVLYALDQPLHLLVLVAEPIQRPDAMEPPAEVSDYLLANPVAITGALGTMVRGAVALDSEYKMIRIVRVPDGEVDAIAGNADLGRHVVTVSLQPALHELLEWALGVATRVLTDLDASGLDVLQIAFQDAHALLAFLAHHDIRGPERGYQDHLPLCAGEQHVEPAVPSLAIDWAEPLLHGPARHLGSVDGRNHDDVALIALDVLQVLHEHGLKSLLPVGGVLVRRIVEGELAVQHLLD